MTDKAANADIANCMPRTLLMSSKLTSANLSDKSDKTIAWCVDDYIENRHR